MFIEGVGFELCIVNMHMKTDHKEILKLILPLKSHTPRHDGIRTVAIGASVETNLRMHMNPDHDKSKTVGIGASLETVENIVHAIEKNQIQLLLQTLHFYDKNAHVMNVHRRGGI